MKMETKHGLTILGCLYAPIFAVCFYFRTSFETFMKDMGKYYNFRMNYGMNDGYFLNEGKTSY